jgi:hypothetical protein
VDKLEWAGHAWTGNTMPSAVHIWSKAYASSTDSDAFSVQVDKSLWERAMRHEGSRRKFLRIEHPDGLPDWIAPIGQPVQDSEDHEESFDNIYMPLWMIDAANLSGSGEEADVEIVDEEFFPQATKIVLRVIDSAFYNADIKEELERALSALGVVRQHTTLQIPIQALGGYAVEVFLAETEPANLVLCDGEEVAVEFQEPVDQIAPPRPPTPIPEPLPLLQTDTMVPDDFVTEPQEPRGFRPFQGQGHTLGGSNLTIPEWRRELGPPRRPPPRQ